MRERREAGIEVEAVTVGRKGRNWLLRYDPVIRAEFTGIAGQPDSPTTSIRSRGFWWTTSRMGISMKS